jgi:CTP:molybdopterin cytidylyltransferase MocA
MVSALVPAAGKGERFGGPKLLADVAGVPMLERTIRCLLEGGVDLVIVTLDGGATIGDAINLRAAVHSFRDPRVAMVSNRAPDRGMFSSIQIAAQKATGDPILVLPGDMPFVRSDTVAALIAAYRESSSIILPTHGGKHGHPIVLPGSLREGIVNANPAETLSSIIKRHTAQEFQVADAGILRDVDRITDLRA